MERQYWKLVGCFGVMCLIVFGVLAADVYGEPLVDEAMDYSKIVDLHNMFVDYRMDDIHKNPGVFGVWRRESNDPNRAGYLVYHLEGLRYVEARIWRHSNGSINNIRLYVSNSMTGGWQEVRYRVKSDVAAQGGWRDVVIEASWEEDLGDYLKIEFAEPHAWWDPQLKRVQLDTVSMVGQRTSVIGNGLLIDDAETTDYVLEYENMTLWAYDKDVWGNAANGAYWRRESFNAELSGHLVYYLEDLNEIEVIMRRHSNGEIGNIKLEVKADEDDPWQPVNFDVLSDQHTQGGWRDFQIKADLSEMEGPLNYFRITISEPNAAWHPVIERVVLRSKTAVSAGQ